MNVHVIGQGGRWGLERRLHNRGEREKDGGGKGSKTDTDGAVENPF